MILIIAHFPTLLISVFQSYWGRERYTISTVHANYTVEFLTNLGLLFRTIHL